MTTIVIVPCGRRKVWDTQPDAGPTAALNAYTGTAFRANRAYAERFSDAWYVLSARHGFISPDFTIPGPYDVSFYDPRTMPVRIEDTGTQVRAMGATRSDRIVALGGKRYRQFIEAAFSESGAQIVAPFSGLGIGRYIQAVREAVADGNSRLSYD